MNKIVEQTVDLSVIEDLNISLALTNPKNHNATMT